VSLHRGFRGGVSAPHLTSPVYGSTTTRTTVSGEQERPRGRGGAEKKKESTAEEFHQHGGLDSQPTAVGCMRSGVKVSLTGDACAWVGWRDALWRAAGGTVGYLYFIDRRQRMERRCINRRALARHAAAAAATVAAVRDAAATVTSPSPRAQPFLDDDGTSNGGQGGRGAGAQVRGGG